MATLTVSNLYKSFGGIHALRGLSFRMQPAEVLGIVGPNGAGKTTAIDTITGRYAPDAGTICLGAHILNGRSPEQIGRAGISRSFQSPSFPTALSVVEYLMLGHDFGPYESRFPALLDGLWSYPRMAAAREVALSVLTTFDWHHLHDRRCSELSGGEQKFLSLIRLYQRNPAVLFLDEPTTALSGALVERLTTIIADMTKRGTAIAVISHDLPFIQRVAKRILVLDDGKGSMYEAGAYGACTPEFADPSTRFVLDKPVDNSCPPGRAVLSLDSVGIRHQGDNLLVDVNLQLTRGEIVTITGANGSGKSTLLRTIHNMHAPFAGTVRFEGNSTLNSQPFEVARAGLGMSLQGARIPPRLTVSHALEMAWASGRDIRVQNGHLRDAVWREVKGPRDVLAHFPALVRRQYVHAGLLSGGEQQLLALAMVFARRPVVVLLDEPSVGLHDEVLREFLTWLDELCDRGLAAIVVEHNIAALSAITDRTLRIANQSLYADVVWTRNFSPGSNELPDIR